MLDTKLKEFISDYFEMTGRPIATMTVEEFCQFSRIFKTENFSSLTDVPQSAIPFQKSEPNIDETNNFFTDPKKDATILPITEKSISEEKNVHKKEKQKPSKEDMLRLMHSVNS